MGQIQILTFWMTSICSTSDGRLELIIWMSSYTNGQTKKLPYGKIYKVLSMQKKTGNNLICKNCSNLQLFKSHILVGTNSPTKYNLINIFLLYSQNQESHSRKKQTNKKPSKHKIKTMSNYIRSYWIFLINEVLFIERQKLWDLVCFSGSTNGLC